MSAGFSDNRSFGSKLLDNLSGQVAPIFSTKNLAKYASGARCILRINNQLVGFAFQVSWRINTQQDEIITIDDYTPYELAPNKITVEGNLGMFHIPGRGASAEHIQANLLSFMTHRYISIEVRDTATNDLLFYTSKAAITSRMEDIKSDDIARVTLSFKAIGWQDEKTPKLQETAEEKQFREDLQGGLEDGTIITTPPDGIPGSFDPGSIA